MDQEPVVIIQVPHGGVVARQIAEQPPPSVGTGEVVVEAGPTDAQGHLEPPAAGRVVLTVPSPETLARQADEVHRVIKGTDTGVEPLVIVVEAADELRDDELAAVLDAARDGSRTVILRIIRDG
jgi:hypothetical protein